MTHDTASPPHGAGRAHRPRRERGGRVRADRVPGQPSLFYPPSEVAAGKAPADRVFRLGGMVEEGSVKRETRQPGSALRRHRFSEGRDGQLQRRAAGSVPRRAGRHRARPLGADGVFVADEVLAKHDENYMPPEVAESLRKQHRQKAPAPTPST